MRVPHSDLMCGLHCCINNSQPLLGGPCWPHLSNVEMPRRESKRLALQGWDSMTLSTKLTGHQEKPLRNQDQLC